ncbi:MAG: PilZ domain-containing protein, partial [Deltaproteobacteria bacterium]|nr:PilZ domain-containing protein [Deltaproteobacteria bacterium]
MNTYVETQNSIVKSIIEGSVTLDSVEDFKNIIEIFPDDPGVYRAYGDFLVQVRSFDAATIAYRKACQLFVDLGMMLQAVVAKILEWRIVRPSHQEARNFHSTLKAVKLQESPLHKFIAQMTYSEMIAFVVKLVRLRFPDRNVVKSFGTTEDNIYFVVSGALKETTYRSIEAKEKGVKESVYDLVENQFFGNIYPFEHNKQSESDVETITHVELVKISKNRLRKICKNHPNVELLVKALYEEHVRKTIRHQLPTKVRIKIFPEEAEKSPLVFDGVTEDISLGGTCLVLSASYRIDSPAELIGKNVKLEMSLPQAKENIRILGTVAWGKKLSHEGKTSTVVGIQFGEMNDRDRTA